MSDTANRIAVLEHQVEKLIKGREEDRETFLNLLDKTSKVIGQTNEREDQHFDDMQKLSDRINLVEGMIDILKDDLNEIRNYIFKEEDIDETS